MRAGIRSFIAVAALTASATLTLFTGNARALGPGICNAYADRAVAQAKQAKDMQCGFGISETGNVEHPGPAWSSDRNAYIRECRKWTSEDTPNERNAARDKELGYCSSCGNYAAEASNRGRENVKFSCGFSGPQWDIYYQPHFDYCMAEFRRVGGTGARPGLGSSALNFESERDAGTQACKDKFSTEQIALCQAYSEKASDQAVWNFQHKCGNAKDGRSWGRWTWNSDHHFAFCTAGLNRARESGGDEAAIKAAMKAEEAVREEANKMCVPNMIRKRPTPEMTRDPSAIEKRQDLDRAEKSRQRSDRAKAAVAPSAAPRENPAASSSAMDRLGGSGTAPASGGSYKSKDGAPTQTRSSGGGGAGTSSSSGELPALRTMPSNTGSMSTGGGEKFRAPN